MKNLSTSPVNRPTAKNGSTNPRVYTPTSRNPVAAEALDDAMSSTLANTGPTHGVHAKLNVKPEHERHERIHGEAVETERQSPLRLDGASLAECAEHVQAECRHDETRQDGEQTLIACEELTERREAEAQQEERKAHAHNEEHVFMSTFTRGYSKVPSSPRFAVPPARYPTYNGISGSTQGEKKLNNPWMNTVMAGTLVSREKPHGGLLAGRETCTGSRPQQEAGCLYAAEDARVDVGHACER